MPRMILLAALIGASGLSAQQQTPFRPRSVTLPAGGAAVVVGDLNRDGHPDVIAAGRDGVTVYLGDGRGNFDRVAGSPFAAGDNPNDLALADFDEDGRIDAVVANHETSYLTLLRGDVKGGLAPPTRIGVPSRPHPHGVAVGDFNGDRHLDVAVESWEENVVLVRYGDGKAGFESEAERLRVGQKPYHKLRAGDLNNDGRDDLVTTNTDGSSVSVLCTGSSGTLQPAKEVSTARSPFAVAIGDVNADGYPDLAVAHRWGSVDPTVDALTVLIGKHDCVFAPGSASPMRVGASPTAVAIGDFDGDGVGDVATANMGSDDVTIVLGSRSGSHPAKQTRVPVGRGPLAIALADLNRDGKADIVTANGGSGDVSVVISP